jgi:RecB family exonuclease
MSVTFSYSSLHLFEQCKWKYKRTFLTTPRPPWEDSEHLAFGSFIHKMLQLYQKQLIKVQKAKDEKWIASTYDEIYDKYMSKYDRAKYYDKGKELLNFAMNIDFDFKRSVAIEHKFSARFDKDTFINGTFDRAERMDAKTFLISDWKTGEAKPQNEMEEDLQYKIYSYAAQVLYPLYAVYKLRWVFLESGQVYELDVYDKDKSKEEIQKRITAINEEKEFPTNITKLCLWCSFYKNGECPDVEKVKDKYEK